MKQYGYLITISERKSGVTWNGTVWAVDHAEAMSKGLAAFKKDPDNKTPGIATVTPLNYAEQV